MAVASRLTIQSARRKLYFPSGRRGFSESPGGETCPVTLTTYSPAAHWLGSRTGARLGRLPICTKPARSRRSCEKLRPCGRRRSTHPKSESCQRDQIGAGCSSGFAGGCAAKPDLENLPLSRSDCQHYASRVY